MHPLPSAVQVGPLRYSVVRPDVGPPGEECGKCIPMELEIRVTKSLPSDLARSTLLHEILHAISDGYGAHLKEKQVLALETGLGALFRDNPKLSRAFFPRP